MRGTGTTTQQMTAAPNGALYIWCNERLDYPLSLAKHLGRKDLIIKTPSALRNWGHIIGRNPEFTAVVVDHATEGGYDEHIGFAKLVLWARGKGAEEQAELSRAIATQSRIHGVKF